MHHLLLVHSSQTCSDLAGDFQGPHRLDPAGAFDQVLERLSLYKLHRVKDFAPAGAEMIDGGNIRVANPGSGSRLAEKAPARQFFLKQL